MINDSYWNTKEILILIISSQIIYDHTEVIQYQQMFIFVLFSIHKQQSSLVSFCSVKSLSRAKTFTSEPPMKHSS